MFVLAVRRQRFRREGLVAWSMKDASDVLHERSPANTPNTSSFSRCFYSGALFGKTKPVCLLQLVLEEERQSSVCLRKQGAVHELNFLQELILIYQQSRNSSWSLEQRFGRVSTVE